MATPDLAVTPRSCHPGGSCALRLEVKNTRRTLVLSKVKCVSRQREELKITRVYTQQILGSPATPPFLASTRNPSVATTGTAWPKPQAIRSHAGGSQGSSCLSSPVLSSRHMDWEVGKDRPCAGWPQASWAISELAIDSG